MLVSEQPSSKLSAYVRDVYMCFKVVDFSHPSQITVNVYMIAGQPYDQFRGVPVIDYADFYAQSIMNVLVELLTMQI